MNDKTTQAEPTMEEILASIRRIISEDGEKAADHPEEKVVPMAAAKPSAPLRAEPEPPVEEDILELTEIVADEEEIAAEPDVEFEPVAASKPEPEPAPESEPEMEEEFEPEIEQDEILETVALEIEEQLAEWGDIVDPADEEEAIVSEGPSDKARSAFMDLSDLLVAGYQGSDNTLEAMVRKMLKPMLKSWLDENLPDIVERVVAREIARLARAKRP